MSTLNYTCVVCYKPGATVRINSPAQNIEDSWVHEKCLRPPATKYLTDAIYMDILNASAAIDLGQPEKATAYATLAQAKIAWNRWRNSTMPRFEEMPPT